MAEDIVIYGDEVPRRRPAIFTMLKVIYPFIQVPGFDAYFAAKMLTSLPGRYYRQFSMRANTARYEEHWLLHHGFRHVIFISDSFMDDYFQLMERLIRDITIINKSYSQPTKIMLSAFNISSFLAKFRRL